MKFEILPVRSVPLSDVAEFLYRWHHHHEGIASSRAIRKAPRSIERTLHWLLVQNPAAGPASLYGFCARDDSGVIRGLSLNFPNSFMVSDKPVLGLCSGSYFVEPHVRTAGFYLFKRYLDLPGYGFFVATTCNANSSAIWSRIGGCAAPDSQKEYLLPIRFDVMLPALLAGRRWSRAAEGIARALGRGGNLATKMFARRSVSLTVEPCRDWDKLSEVARRHRSDDLITAERSTTSLQWRYAATSPNPSADICVFRDSYGNEGWFSLGHRMLGRHGQVCGGILLDAIWPREKMDFGDILPAIVQRAAASCDAIYFPPRPDVDYDKCSAWLVSRTLEAPRVWAMAPKGGMSLDWSCLDIVIADGDSGWSNRFENEPASIGESVAAR
jgi:hypothetical protein